MKTSKRAGVGGATQLGAHPRSARAAGMSSRCVAATSPPRSGVLGERRQCGGEVVVALVCKGSKGMRVRLVRCWAGAEDLVMSIHVTCSLATAVPHEVSNFIHKLTPASLFSPLKAS